MAKIEWKKTLDGYQAKKGAIRQLIIPPTQYVMMDGHGDPNHHNTVFDNAVNVLFHTSYMLKFFSKDDLGKDYTVPPLEGLWWADDMDAFTTGDKEAWNWTLMLMVPNWIMDDAFEDIIDHFHEKKPDKNITTLRLEDMNEGLVVQTLHIGPFDEEGPVISDMHSRYMPENNLTPRGKHHEVYLSMSRNNSATWRTILRQPVTLAT